LEHGVRATSQPRSSKRKLCDVDSSELFEYCIEHKVGYGYYNEEKKRRDTDECDILTDVTEGSMVTQLLQLNPNPESNLSTVIIGKSGTGKTTWAIKHAIKPALLVTHMDDLKKLRPRHKSIIFDDMSFYHMPVTAQIHIADNDLPRSIHVRYGVARIPKCTKKIFTCNEYPFTRDIAALERRILLIQVD